MMRHVSGRRDEGRDIACALYATRYDLSPWVPQSCAISRRKIFMTRP